MPLGERVKGRLRYGLDNPFTRNIDPTLVLDLPFSEGVGNTARDRSLYGNHGTIYGASWVDGKIGKALSFDGVDDYVAIPDGIVSSTARYFTVSAWVFLRVLDFTFRVLVYSGANKGEYSLEIFNDNAFTFGVKLSDANWYWVKTAGVSDVFKHITGVRRETVIEIYVDGELKNTTEIPDLDLWIFSGYASSIGSYNRGISTFCNGIIDEVRIYNRALSAPEILRLYNAGK